MNIDEFIQESPIIIHYFTTNLLLEQENPADLIALHMLLSANKYNQLTNKEIMEKLHWRQRKTKKIVNQLIELKIINSNKILIQ